MAGLNLTEEQLDAWRAELVAIDSQIAALNERKALLQNILALAAMVQRETEGEWPKEPDEGNAPPIQLAGSMRLTDAILYVLRRYGQPMTPQEIRQRLKEVGYSKEHRGPYFYTAFKRLRANNHISKVENGRYTAAERASSPATNAMKR